MTAKCSKCGKRWNISVHRKIPKNGYICPHCAEKEKRLRDSRPNKAQSKILTYRLAEGGGYVK